MKPYVTVKLTRNQAAVLYQCANYGKTEWGEVGSDPYGGFVVTGTDWNSLVMALDKLAAAISEAEK